MSLSLPRIPIFEHMTPKRVARFWFRIDRRGEDECWPWMGRLTPHGYGSLSIEPRGSGQTLNLLAHRVAKTLELGRDVSDLGRHSCDYPACCNFKHILEGSAYDNAHDAIERGRASWMPDGSHPMIGVYGADHPASQFDAETRARAVAMCLENGKGRAEVARLFGCHRETLHRWLWQARPDAFAMPRSVARVRKAL